MDERFWNFLNKLIETHPIVIDRPAGSHHPDFPDLIYPLDYGFLEGTHSMDGAGIDVGVGTTAQKALSGILCTIDLNKNDSEIKIILNCDAREARSLLKFHNSFSQAAIWIARPNL